MSLDYRRILVPFDFSDSSRAALEEAARIAIGFRASVDLVFVWEGPAKNAALPGGPFPESDPVEPSRRVVREELDRVVDSLGSRGIRSTGTVRSGPPAKTLLQAASEYDLIVMGTHGRSGLAHLILGSVAETMLRSAQKPVLAVRGGAGRAVTPVVLAPTDLSAYSEQAIAYAADFTRTLGGKLNLVHVVEPTVTSAGDPRLDMQGVALSEEVAQAARRLEEIAELLQAAGLDTTAWTRTGAPGRAILDVAEETGADLIVMATHARKGVERFVLGSVTENVIRASPCPVLAAPPTVLAAYVSEPLHPSPA